MHLLIYMFQISTVYIINYFLVHKSFCISFSFEAGCSLQNHNYAVLSEAKVAMISILEVHKKTYWVDF